jgi:hypothetical protein
MQKSILYMEVQDDLYLFYNDLESEYIKIYLLDDLLFHLW